MYSKSSLHVGVLHHPVRIYFAITTGSLYIIPYIHCLDAFLPRSKLKLNILTIYSFLLIENSMRRIELANNYTVLVVATNATTNVPTSLTVQS